MCCICVSWKGYSSVEFLTPQRKKSHLIPLKTRNCSSCSAVTLKRKLVGIWTLALTASIGANDLLFLIYVYRQKDWRIFRLQRQRDQWTVSWAKEHLAGQKGCFKVFQKPHRGLSPVSFWLSHIADNTQRAITGWETQAASSSWLLWTEKHLWYRNLASLYFFIIYMSTMHIRAKKQDKQQ